MFRTMFFGMASTLVTYPAFGARLSLSLGPTDNQLMRMDIVWTMQQTDTPVDRLTALDLRFNVAYPTGADDALRVVGISALPDWETSATMGIGEPFNELNFYLGVGDGPGIAGIAGNGSEFSTTAASVFLQVEGDVAGTEISFRHNNPLDPLPAAWDGPVEWDFRWQEAVTGPFQFDLGVGNPGDGNTFGYNWPSPGLEPYQPLVIPEPGAVTVLLLGALAYWRRCRSLYG